MMMNLEQMKHAHAIMKERNASFFATIFHIDLCNDMGEDDATVTIYAQEDDFLVHYIRSESGVFDEEFDCRIIDEYKRVMNLEQLLDYLLFHQLMVDFEGYIKTLTNT